jgi:hypothetical protein
MIMAGMMMAALAGIPAASLFPLRHAVTPVS